MFRVSGIIRVCVGRVHTRRLNVRTSSDPNRVEIPGIFEQRMSKQRRISDRLILYYSDSWSSTRVKLVTMIARNLAENYMCFLPRGRGNNYTSAGNASFMFPKYKF